MNISFEKKVALVTGAASGLGLATARAFAESGASVVLVDWNEKAVRSAVDELAAKGHEVVAVRCDVSDDAPTKPSNNGPPSLTAIAPSPRAFGEYKMELPDEKKNGRHGALSDRWRSASAS
jgi:NAD(P)-dependent dehydrogenase (short-subunit alcohol dehydrogenase family)